MMYSSDLQAAYYLVWWAGVRNAKTWLREAVLDPEVALTQQQRTCLAGWVNWGLSLEGDGAGCFKG